MKERCKRCWEINPAEVHTCTQWHHYKGVTGTWTLPNRKTYTFEITSVLNTPEWRVLDLLITSWINKDKHYFIEDYLIDDSLKFNI